MLLELCTESDRLACASFRLTEGGLELDDSADSAAADATSLAASTVEHMRGQAAPLDAQQQVLAAVWNTAEATSATGEDTQLFKPVPVSSLQPRARVSPPSCKFTFALSWHIMIHTSLCSCCKIHGWLSCSPVRVHCRLLFYGTPVILSTLFSYINN